MKCPCLAQILANLLAHQTELAEHFSLDDNFRNQQRRKVLAAEIRENAAEFQRFVAEYRIEVKKRRPQASRA